MAAVNLKEIRRELSESRSRLAFVIGNGINRYQSDTPTWEDMLLHLYHLVTGNELNSIEKGILYTEFYNLLQVDGETTEQLRQEVIAYTNQHYKPTAYHNQLQRILMGWQVPVLTTNFDNCLEQGCSMYRMKNLDGPSRRFTDYYPWEVYYSNHRLTDPLNGFGVWHINGMTKYRRSIRLSLSEYINQTSRASKFIHSDESLMNFDRKNKVFWNGYNTWLHVFFNTHLCIFGLGLDVNETFLRWMMIERERYFRKFPDRRMKGWFIYTKKDQMEAGKRLFLQSTGFEEVLLNDYEDMYEGIFG